MKRADEGRGRGPRTSRRALRAARRTRRGGARLRERDHGLGGRQAGKSAYAHTGGGPNACMLGSDGPGLHHAMPDRRRLGAPEALPALDSARLSARRRVELVVTEADGMPLNAPNDLSFGPGRTPLLHRLRRLGSRQPPHRGYICVIEHDGTCHVLEELQPGHPNGDRGRAGRIDRLVGAYTRREVRRTGRHQAPSSTSSPEGHVPDGVKIDTEGQLLASRRSLRRSSDVIPARRRRHRFPRRRGASRLISSSTGAPSSSATSARPTPAPRPPMFGRLLRDRRRCDRIAPLSRRDLLKGTPICESIPIEAIPVSYPEPNDFNALRHLCLQDYSRRRPCRMGRVDHPVSRSQLATKAVIEGMAENLVGKRSGPHERAMESK